jgi:hypothetical protein
MKMNYLILPFALMLTFSLRHLPAADAQITPVNFPTSLPQGDSVTGPITNIDPVNQMIQVKDPIGMIQTFRVDQNILILKNGTSVRLSSLNLGDVVTVISK